MIVRHFEPHDHKRARRERSTRRTATRPPVQPPIRTARLEAASAQIDLTRWRSLRDRLLAPPLPCEASTQYLERFMGATPLAVAQTDVTKGSRKNLAIGGGGHV